MPRKTNVVLVRDATKDPQAICDLVVEYSAQPPFKGDQSIFLFTESPLSKTGDPTLAKGLREVIGDRPTYAFFTTHLLGKQSRSTEDPYIKGCLVGPQGIELYQKGETNFSRTRDGFTEFRVCSDIRFKVTEDGVRYILVPAWGMDNTPSVNRVLVEGRIAVINDENKGILLMGSYPGSPSVHIPGVDLNRGLVHLNTQRSVESICNGLQIYYLKVE